MNFCINDTCQAVCCDKKPTYMRKDSKGFLSIYVWQSECEVVKLLQFYALIISFLMILLKEYNYLGKIFFPLSSYK